MHPNELFYIRGTLAQHIKFFHRLFKFHLQKLLRMRRRCNGLSILIADFRYLHGIGISLRGHDLNFLADRKFISLLHPCEAGFLVPILRHHANKIILADIGIIGVTLLIAVRLAIIEGCGVISVARL